MQSTLKLEKDAAPPTLKTVKLSLEWNPPENPEFPIKMYYISIRDNNGNTTNYPVDKTETTYEITIDISKNNPSFAIVGASYVIGPPGVSPKAVAFNVQPNT